MRNTYSIKKKSSNSKIVIIPKDIYQKEYARSTPKRNIIQVVPTLTGYIVEYEDI